MTIKYQVECRVCKKKMDINDSVNIIYFLGEPDEYLCPACYKKLRQEIRAVDSAIKVYEKARNKEARR